MNLEEIESLKATLIQLTRQGCNFHCLSNGFHGTIVGIGFKPLWTNPSDSKIDQLEFNYMDSKGMVRQYILHNIIGYELISNENKDDTNLENITIDIHVYSLSKSKHNEPYDKIRISISPLSTSG